MHVTIGKRAQFALAIIVLQFLISCAPTSQAKPPLSKAWTLMVYSCADCDLEGYQLSYMTKMATVGSTADVDIVVQIDRVDGYSSSFGDWTDCKRFYVTKGLTPTGENAIGSLGEVNMGDPNTLLDFLTWAVQEYPANRYFAMIIGHGWIDGVCFDWSNHGSLTSLEIQWALNQVKNTTGVEVDVIGFEACQQSALEIAYEIGDSPDLVIASQEVSTHWPYSYILSDLVASPTMNLSSLASMIVDYYAQYSWMGGPIMTLAAFNLSKIKTEVATTTAELANNLIANITRYGHAIIRAISATEPHSPIPDPYRYTSCHDLYDFAFNIKQEISDPSIQFAAQNLMNAIDNACIAEWHGSGHPNFHGLYIYLPEDEDVYKNRVSLYGKTYSLAHPLWTQDSTWDDLLFVLFRIHAEGLRSREQIAESSYTSFDSDNDSYLDALHLQLSVCTMGEPINVTAQGFLIDPQGDIVDQCNNTWTINGENSVGDIYLHTPSGGEEGWYDVEVILYDEYGIYEDFLYSDNVAYLPEEMQHDVKVNDISITKTIVGQGFPAKINVTIGNIGHYTETLNVTTYANGTIIDTTQLIIPNGASVSFAIHWDTTSQTKGNYTITSFAEPVDGEAHIVDNTFVANEEVCVTVPGDVDADFDVDLFDAVKLLLVYGVGEGEPDYDPNCDIDGDGDIDLYEAVILLTHYGQAYP